MSPIMQSVNLDLPDRLFGAGGSAKNYTKAMELLSFIVNHYQLFM